MLSPDETFGGYRIDRELGRGGQGVVYKATQLSLRRVVALKLLAPMFSNDPRVLARFRTEGVVQAAIDHPNVVPIYESGEHDGQLFLAMKFIEGTDLKQQICGGALRPEGAIELLAPVAAALDAAHRQGYVHRDVKSSNILVGGDGRPYLADFGLTKDPVDADRTLTGAVMGTAGYLAPEQAQGRPATSASDVYALATVLYECLTGQLPFAGRSDAATLRAHVNEPPPRITAVRPELPPALNHVIARGLAKEPTARPRSASELVRQAAAALADDTRETPTATRMPDRATAPSRRRLLVAIALAAVAAAMVVAVLALTGGGDPPRTDTADNEQGATDNEQAATASIPADSAAPAGSLQVDGEPVLVSIERSGQHATLRFEGQAGDRLTAFASDVAFGRDDAGSARIMIWEPGREFGQPLMSGAVSATTGEVGDSVTLPDTGTYTVIIEPDDAATGSLRLALPRDARGRLRVDGDAVPVRLTRPGQHATLRFEGQAGDRLTAFASDVAFGRDDAGSARIMIWEPGREFGQPLMSGAVSATTGEVGDSVTLPDTGTYTVIIEPDDAATGSLRLALPRDARGRLRVDGDAVPVRLTRPGQHATLRFEGQAGDRLTAFASDVAFGRDDAGSARIMIWEPGREFGQPLMSGAVSATTGEVGDSVTLPDTGTYTVIIEPDDAATGSLRLALPRDARGEGS